ncbi:4'-phosphopantetheinyl transferase family protein [Pedobacter gandavensis]|uniref:4'-phosphopantetheinyl transferase superfamily protein n=1 Tax=Pedobacter gandavensis TaxID=2679963 RepID=A0ABR6F129_9SPHI|nr:4'-phosphopantetheinyl transferase superfamily protein [Pedobacter gandavensis]MBB2151233.1 4'-phosphopantetheinyl transferase superfamily protein [Pedobacter gandavensis]
MIGNDIVDLRQAMLESNWRRKGYLDKLFSRTEQLWIEGTSKPTQMIWLLWSMKEAAYKIHSRRKNWRAFAPLKLICQTLEIKEELATGSIQCENITFFSQTILATDFIHTVVSEQYPMQAIKVNISTYNPGDCSYRSTDPATVSHHGRFLALAYLK